MPQSIVENKESRSSYRSIFKATSLFGGVQVYTILIRIIRSKIVALFLGPFGIGVQGLYQSALDLVKHATSLGIAQSAVLDVAEANGTGDAHRVSTIITVLHRIVWFTGLLGMVVVIAASPILSKTSFGDNTHILPFIILSVILLIEQLSVGQKVVLQGLRRMKDLAKASAIGATISLVLTVPFYIIWKVDGIVPALIVSALVAMSVSWYYSRKVKFSPVRISFRETVSEGKNMIVMGFFMSITSLLTMAVSYVLRSLIRKWGGTEDVGLFQAGFVIMNTYVGLVFNAMATDYYPRLAAINKDNEKCNETISHQGEVSVLILAPLLILCIIAMPLIIRILYSDQFLPIGGYIKWACLGMMFRLIAWLISYTFVAKADSKLFAINETVANFLYLALSLVGYRLWGLTGLGIAFFVQYILYFLQVFLIAKFRYGFRFTRTFIKVYLVQLLVVVASFLTIMLVPGPARFVLGSLLLVVSAFVSIRGLNSRLDLRAILQRGGARS